MAPKENRIRPTAVHPAEVENQGNHQLSLSQVVENHEQLALLTLLWTGKPMDLFGQ